MYTDEDSKYNFDIWEYFSMQSMVIIINTMSLIVLVFFKKHFRQTRSGTFLGTLFNFFF